MRKQQAAMFVGRVACLEGAVITVMRRSHLAAARAPVRVQP
jgi:hypothetical protein